MKTPTVRLLDGNVLPILGFGSGTKWRIAKASGETEYIPELAEQITTAIKAGFTHIDTAEAYKTHEEVGNGIAEANVPRESLFVTDKYHPWSYKWRKGTGPYQSLQVALEKMKLSYVDMYLLHMPIINLETAGIDLKEAWRQMEKIKADGLAKSIGVSNFGVEHLEELKKYSNEHPVVNQIEFNPYLQQQSPKIIEYCRENNIVIEGYSPLVPLTKGRPGPLDEILPEIATKYGKTELQVLLRWSLQNNIVVLTTSGNPERVHQSVNIFDFELTPQEMDLIATRGKEKVVRGFLGDVFDKYNNVLYN